LWSKSGAGLPASQVGERMCLPADEVCYNKLGGRASGAVKMALFPLIR
jgi:hypothetical protein